MRKDDRLAHLIGDIYDAALDPTLWPDTLTKIADFTGGQAAGIFSKDSATRGGRASHTAGIAPEYVQLYEDAYATVDPMAPLLFVGIEEVTSTTDFIAYDDFREGRFYQEWARPQGWVDAASAVLDKSMTSFDFLSIVRHETRGLVDDEMSMRLRLITPHVRRAVAVGKAIDLRHDEAATFGDILDGLSAGVFFVDASSRLVHANTAGRAILMDQDFLYSARDRLVARDAEIDEALSALFVAAAKGDAAVGVGGIAMPLVSRDGERYVAHVLPLTSGSGRRAGISKPAIAALFVHKAAMETPSLPDTIVRHYALTPTELRVLLSIIDVGGAPEVAEALGIGPGTVKTHLARLYQKTGTGRQADLVKLVAGFSSPLLS